MALQIENLDLVRGTRALQIGLSFTLARGAALWVRGSNGVGKSTLLETICGFRTPMKGAITWNGVDLRKDIDNFHNDSFYCGHKNGNAPALTCEDALGFYARLYGANAERMADALRVYGLEKRRKVQVSMLSAGQQRRLALARLLLKDARLWILDEPSVSLDQEGVALLKTQIDAHLQAGGMVLFTSHVDLGIAASELVLQPLERKFVDESDAFMNADWEGVA